jgi:transcriptional regulator with XRE-family HTH domain
MMDHEKFEQRFEQLAAKNGYHRKYYVLAQKLGYSENTLYRYVNSLSFPPVALLDKLCDMWGVSMDYLTGRSDVM